MGNLNLEIEGSPWTGALDGMTILRFAHAYRAGAGLEYDIEVVNRALGARHRLQTILIHLAKPSDPLGSSTEANGLGTLVRIPVVRDIAEAKNPTQPEVGPGFRGFVRNALRDWVMFNPLVYPWLSGRMLARHAFTRRQEDIVGAGELVRGILSERRVDLVVLHSVGGSDAAEIIQEARKASVPFAVQLHFANERFMHSAVREQIRFASGVSGVSDVRLPRYLKGKFANLGTAVDTSLFDRSQAAPLPRPLSGPTLFLPARIVPEKGHMDMVKVARMLSQMGVVVNVVFAGRADQPGFEADLRRKISDFGLEKQFHFVGMLDQVQLRDWYAASHVLAFPTYHQEGLPRILLEAQSMRLPVVVYDSGGSRAGLIDGETGWVVRPGDLAAFASKVRDLVVDADLRRGFGDAGRLNVERNFGLQALAGRHEGFCLRTLAKTSNLGNPRGQARG